MYYNNQIIKIYFKKPFYKNINELFFSNNQNIIYYDNSHINYIYKNTENNIEYTFYGFFKDTFFVIIFDIFDKNTNIMIQNKNVLVIKIDWILKKISENISIWSIDNKLFKNYQSHCYILPLRNKIFNENNVSLEDYMKLVDYKRIEIIINNVDNISFSKKNTFKKKILSLFNFSNQDF